MKSILTILCFVLMCPLGFQAQGMSSPKEDAYKELPTEVADLVKAHERDTTIRTVHYPMVERSANVYVSTNDEVLPKYLQEFYDSANYYQVDYKDELIRLKKIHYVKADNYFLGEVSEDKTTIYLNSNLKNYKYLSRVVFLRQMGKLYGLKPKGAYKHSIMSDHWEIDVLHEKYAEFLYNRPQQKKEFFEALEKKHSLDKQI
jgi:hypothetical protein